MITQTGSVSARPHIAKNIAATRRSAHFIENNTLIWRRRRRRRRIATRYCANHAFFGCVVFLLFTWQRACPQCLCVISECIYYLWDDSLGATLTWFRNTNYVRFSLLDMPDRAPALIGAKPLPSETLYSRLLLWLFFVAVGFILSDAYIYAAKPTSKCFDATTMTPTIRAIWCCYCLLEISCDIFPFDQHNKNRIYLVKHEFGDKECSKLWSIFLSHINTTLQLHCFQCVRTRCTMDNCVGHRVHIAKKTKLVDSHFSYKI